MSSPKPFDLDTLDVITCHTSRAFALASVMFDGSDALADQTEETKDLLGQMLREQLSLAQAAHNKLYDLHTAA